MVTAAMTTIASIAAGMSQPMFFLPVVTPFIGVHFYSLTTGSNFTEGRSVCQAPSNAAATIAASQ
jgi:hypothetical protein